MGPAPLRNPLEERQDRNKELAPEHHELPDILLTRATVLSPKTYTMVDGTRQTMYRLFTTDHNDKSRALEAARSHGIELLEQDYFADRKFRYVISLANMQRVLDRKGYSIVIERVTPTISLHDMAKRVMPVNASRCAL